MTSERPSTDGFPRWAPLLARIAREVEPTPDGVSVQGHLIAEPGTSDPRLRREALSRLLYRRYYLHHDSTDAPGAWEPGDAHPRPNGDTAWMRRVRHHLGTRQAWETGWTLTGRTGRGALMTRDGVTVEFEPTDARVTDGLWQVRLPADRPALSAGYLLVIGQTGAGTRAAEEVRIYLDLTPEAAPQAFGQLVHSLDDSQIPFCAKLLDHRDGFPRPDAAVVYGPRVHAAALVGHTLDLQAGQEKTFLPGVPAFTLPLAPGVALAEQPRGPIRHSFGKHRCDLLAEGLLNVTAPHRPSARLEAMLLSWTAAGIDPHRPHLNPASADLAIHAPVAGAA